jgi:hypothetical protein
MPFIIKFHTKSSNLLTIGSSKKNLIKEDIGSKCLAILYDYQYICTLINHQQTYKTMKKLIFLLAVAGMFAVTACNSAPKTDAAAADTTAVQAAADTTVAQPAADTAK